MRTVRRSGPPMLAAVGLGCSLGDRHATIRLALRRLAAKPGLTLLRTSRLHRSPPLRGSTARGWFLNAVAVLDCSLGPYELLACCQSIESAAGRRPRVFWGDRPLDLDVLLVGDLTTEDPDLVLPHRAIPDRHFVLYPLLEVWPDAVDARTGTPYASLPPPPGPRSVPTSVVARKPGRINGCPPGSTPVHIPPLTSAANP